MKIFGYFKRPVGPAADVRELEYISALHQISLPDLRTNGTISAVDVKIFLRSRYGVDLTEDESIDIVQGLQGMKHHRFQRKKKPSKEVPKRQRFRRKITKNRKATSSPTDDPRNGSNEAVDNSGTIQISIESKDGEKTDPATEKHKKLLEGFSIPAINSQSKRSDTGSSSLLAPPTSMDFRKSWKMPDLHQKLKQNSVLEEEEVIPTDCDKVQLDLVQMFSILMIPTLIRLVQSREGTASTSAQLSPEMLTGAAASPMAEDDNYRTNNQQQSWFTQITELLFKFIFLPIDYFNSCAIIEKEMLQPKPYSLIGDVLKILLAQSTSKDNNDPIGGSAITPQPSEDAFPKLPHVVVTKELIRQLLGTHGENTTTIDDKLLQDMVDMIGGEGSILDEESFAKGLVGDVERHWEFECEDKLSTTFHDVYGFNPLQCNEYRKHAKVITEERETGTTKPAITAAKDRSVKLESKQSSSSSSSSSLFGASSNNSDSFYSAKSSLRYMEQSYREEVQNKPKLQLVEENTSPAFINIPKFKPMASFLDYDADNFRSPYLVLAIFGLYIFASVYLMAVFQALTISQYDCKTDTFESESGFFCLLIKTIWSWLALAVFLSGCGLVIIFPLALGNHQYDKCPFRVILAFFFLSLYSLVPAIVDFLVDNGFVEASVAYREFADDVHFRPLRIVYWSFAGLIFIELFTNLVSFLIPVKYQKQYFLLRFFFLASDIKRCRNTKKSATLKMNSIIEHAYKLHQQTFMNRSRGTGSDSTLLNFVLDGEKLESCGGFFWTWFNAFTHITNLFKGEGIWIPVRILVGQASQVVLYVTLLVVWWKGTKAASRAAEDARAVYDGDTSYKAQSALRILPTEFMINVSFYGGGVVAFLMCTIILATYLPNTVSTTLKFRSGVIPSLHDPEFSVKYRKHADMTYYNVGNMIYGFIGSFVLFFVIIGGLLFLLLWPISQPIMIGLLGWGVGMGITTGIKMLLTMCCRSSSNRAFYRNRPAAANMYQLLLECWNIGLGAGVMLGRMLQFLMASAFWMGRIDSTFLSDEVEMFGYKFDYVPMHFRKEILVHEAHRHPFLDRLSGMYLMRLKHGNNFGSDAGAAWRNLFVLGLMPWLLKYRVDPENIDEEDYDYDDGECDEDYNAEADEQTG